MENFIFNGHHYRKSSLEFKKNATFDYIARKYLGSVCLEKDEDRWNYKNFYAEAKKVGLGEVDVFEICKGNPNWKENWLTVIPCENYLFYAKEKNLVN